VPIPDVDLQKQEKQVPRDDQRTTFAGSISARRERSPLTPRPGRVLPPMVSVALRARRGGDRAQRVRPQAI
jgi:hypothetical protein